MSSSPNRHVWHFCLLLAPLLLATGCSTLGLTSDDSVLSPEITSRRLPDADEEIPSQPTFVMDVQPAGKEAKTARLPLEPTLTVQEALVKSRVITQFKRMNLELYRQLPDGSNHKIDLEFDPKTRSVPNHYDYALHPNDRLVVIQDTSTTFDDMLQSVSGAVGL